MDIDSVKKQIDQDLQNINTTEQLEGLKNKYLGRKGIIAELTGSITALPQEQRC